jgi:uncharacterized protein (TIGR00255 family)
MTGFGAGEVTVGDGRIVAEIRSVNHRFLEVRARLPRELADMTLFAEQVARERLRRGRFDLGVRTEGSVLAGARLDKARAREALRALAELRDEVAPGAEIPLSLLGAVPDLFTSPTGPEVAEAREALRAAVHRAIDAMDAMCLTEGAALAADLRARADAAEALLRSTAARYAVAQDGVRQRMRERLARLIGRGELTVDAARLEAEVVLLAERNDVTEELTRLESHLQQFGAILDASDREPVGRRLDFLLQEMLREVNTLGAKAQDASVSQQVVGVKVELERIREQIQNVE